MNFSIAFRNLPFTPVPNQVIYIENEYSEPSNLYIRQHFRDIELHYKKTDREFVYLPYVTLLQDIEERVRYYAPYLRSDIVFPELPKSDILLQFMANLDNRSKIQPSIIWFDSQEGDDYIFNGITIEKDNDFYWHFVPEQLIETHPNATQYSIREDDGVRACEELEDYNAFLEERERCRKENSWRNRMRRGSRSFFKKKIEEEDNADHSVCYSRIPNELKECKQDSPSAPNQIEPYIDDIDVEDTIRDLERTVARLQLKGITLAAIHEMIDKQEKLSRMVITEDYRIFLPDYGNREIEITPIAKALYFLFLRYPEGIRIKELADHHTELFNIYRQLKPNFNEAKMHVTITEITNPFSNRVHEKMSLIRAAFLKQFDEHLAQHYFITGIAGEEYKITLDRNLIEWQEEE